MQVVRFLVAILIAATFVVNPALAQARGRAVGSSSSMTTTPAIGPAMTGGVPGTLGGTPTSRASITAGIPGTLGAAPFDSGGSTTGAIGGASTQGTSTTGSTDLSGTSIVGSSTGAAHRSSARGPTA
jgi:hypothetical protein